MKSDIGCEVLSLRYDFCARRGELYMPAGDCCDMSGCIDLFESINPEAQMISTFSGDEPDTRYVRGSDWWRAL